MPRDRTTFRVDFDDETVAMLIDLCAECGKPPRRLIAELVRDVLVDDAREHAPAPSILN